MLGECFIHNTMPLGLHLLYMKRGNMQHVGSLLWQYIIASRYQTCCFFVLFARRYAGQKYFLESSRLVKHLQQVCLQHIIISDNEMEMYFSDTFLSLCHHEAV